MSLFKKNQSQDSPSRGNQDLSTKIDKIADHLNFLERKLDTLLSQGNNNRRPGGFQGRPDFKRRPGHFGGNRDGNRPRGNRPHSPNYNGFGNGNANGNANGNRADYQNRPNRYERQDRPERHDRGERSGNTHSAQPQE